MSPKFGLILCVENTISYDRLIKMSRASEPKVGKEYDCMQTLISDIQCLPNRLYQLLFACNSN